MVHSGELRRLLESPYNPSRPSGTALKRTARQLGSSQVDQLVADYLARASSIYVLAARYKVHRTTIAKPLKDQVSCWESCPSSDIRRAKALQIDGLSRNAIGINIGRDPKTVKAALSVPSVSCP